LRQENPPAGTAAPSPASSCARRSKDHGTEQKIDGNFTPGSTVILFDDVTTKGGSVMKAVRAVRSRGARVAKIITLVDRLEGATENLGKEGIELVALYTTRELLG
jgi:orotate phosphoribosyltransferase